MQRKFLRIPVLFFAAASLLLAPACSDDDDNPTGPTVQTGFGGGYVMENWTDSGITDGTTSIDPSSGTTDTAAFAYDVDLGNPGSGVTQRTATFEVPVPESGTLSADWEYAGFHAFFQTNAELAFYTDSDTMAVVDQAVSGNFTLSGTVTIGVEAGETFGLEVGGRNFDSNSRLRGTVTLTNFRRP